MAAMMMMMMMMMMTTIMIIVLNSGFIFFNAVDDKEAFYLAQSYSVMKLLNLISQVVEFNRVLVCRHKQ
jgi:uncharacterized protein YxeA